MYNIPNLTIPYPDYDGFPPIDETSSWKEIERRIRKKTTFDIKTDCWLFNGATTRGYGQIWDGTKLQFVHRIAAVIYLGYDLDDKEHQINHKDDICPYRNCWFWEHLYIGTAQENTIDSVIKRTHYHGSKTHCKRDHEFIPENTWIDPKTGIRHCRTCNMEAQRKYRERHGK